MFSGVGPIIKAIINQKVPSDRQASADATLPKLNLVCVAVSSKNSKTGTAFQVIGLVNVFDLRSLQISRDFFTDLGM
jgi:hypothetical protein